MSKQPKNSHDAAQDFLDHFESLHHPSPHKDYKTKMSVMAPPSSDTFTFDHASRNNPIHQALYDEKHRKTKHFVTFHAHGPKIPSLSGASPGHVWVSFGAEDELKQMSVDHGSFGKHPQHNHAKGFHFSVSEGFKPVPGVVKDDSARTEDASVTFQTTQGHFNAAFHAAKSPAGDYTLLGKNCEDFQNKLAVAAGLKPGDGGNAPVNNVNTIAVNNRPKGIFQSRHDTKAKPESDWDKFQRTFRNTAGF